MHKTRVPTRALAAAALGAAGWEMRRRHRRRISADPHHAILSTPPAGRAVSVCSADGTMLHAEVFGPEGAPTLVLAHGWTEALRYWSYQIRELSSELRVVAYDLRGHGRSGRSAGGDYSLLRFGEDVEAVLATCTPAGERAVIAGHSLGAMSIAAWAEHHDVEARVSAAALLNTGLGGLIEGHMLHPRPRFARRFTDLAARRGFFSSRAPIPPFSSPLHHAVIRHLAFGPAATPAQVEFYERMMVACPADVRAACGRAMADMDLHHALVRLTVPTLVMAGACDRLTPLSHARRIAGLLPNLIELVELPETGHMGPLERPAEVSARLRELVALAPRVEVRAA